MNTLDQTLGEIAANIPGATAVFHRHQLNFCCGGKQTLRAAVAKHNLNAEAIARELELLSSAKSFPQVEDESSLETLIEHILTRYHDMHRRQFPELIRLAGRVELVHGGRPDCPAGLTYHLEKIYRELAAHMEKEERILFPMLARGIRGMAVAPIAMMRAEHEQHGESLARLRQLTHDMTLPSEACNTWRALYVGLEALIADLMDHIHLENNILFERIDGVAGKKYQE